MAEFLNSIKNPYWWITVVIVGIAINLFSAYLKQKLDTRVSSLSIWWRDRSEKLKTEEANHIKSLRADKHEQVMLAFQNLRDCTRAILFLITTLTYVTFYLIVRLTIPEAPKYIYVLLLAIAATSIFLSFLFYRSSMKADVLIYKASEKIE